MSPGIPGPPGSADGRTEHEEETAGLLGDLLEGSGRVVTPGGLWLDVDDPGFRPPDQGWKLHVSAHPLSLAETLRRAVPVLTATSCRFKVIRSRGHLDELNSVQTPPGSVGKAITVYPAPDRVTGLAHDLADALTGLSGPRINSDRRVRADAPVYYRYGPFRARMEFNDNGDLYLCVTDPDGRAHPGVAGPVVWTPPWLDDPFAPKPPQDAAAAAAHATAQPGGDAAAAGQGTVPQPITLGGRYPVQEAITINAKGGVYRATDPGGGRTVILKEALAHVNQDDQGRDVRTWLSHERHVLHLLRSVAGVPKVIDHFRHGAADYLALTDVGAHTLLRDVIDNGPFRGAWGVAPPQDTVPFTTGRDRPAPDGAGPDRADPDRPGRDAAGLAAALLSTLDEIHRHGVIARDLAPKNVVMDADGRPHLIDFQISHVEGAALHGWTPGYSSPEQEQRRPPCIEDDYYSLGATLFYAVTGLAPVWLAGDPRNHDVGRVAALLDGRDRTGVIVGLMSPDPAMRRAAAQRLRSGHVTQPTPSPAPSTASTASPRRPIDLPAITGHTLGQVIVHAETLLTGRERSAGGFANPAGASYGAAGIGMELLHHLDRPGVDDLVRALAYWSCGMLTLQRPPASLMMGTTGTALFVAATGRALDDATLLTLADGMPSPPPHRIEQHDFMHGVTGIGLGRLHLWHLTGGAAHLSAAVRYAGHLVARDPSALDGRDVDYDDCTAVSRTLGLAHGLAGATLFLHALHAATNDPSIEATARKYLSVLGHHLPGLLEAARRPTARPMHASFCQGLAGIGAVLTRVATPADPQHLDLAGQAAAACLRLAPTMIVVSQCCGLAGLGEFYLDLHDVTGDTAYQHHATTVAEHILDRAGGTPDAPVLPDHSQHGTSGGWATGSSGVLSFLRRLHAPHAPRLWIDPPAVPATERTS
ncbi:protein kinase/lanthionine synthetase C family protein [Actinomadura graeca]|uniref:non-specific serine/threonine protein kinase n=1 Tax=Actinomadura graeca TaxID=2750812 RepID=A0ABX8QY97_9ACTN|nr:class IV lanthionine synthetase LanL [Actinomadura graeca]QXJ23811.1 protein kinase/lanthionine synthetase C family protein [Actinomadura graeca]